jgi:hypothetical protein
MCVALNRADLYVRVDVRAVHDAVIVGPDLTHLGHYIDAANAALSDLAIHHVDMARTYAFAAAIGLAVYFWWLVG